MRTYPKSGERQPGLPGAQASGPPRLAYGTGFFIACDLVVTNHHIVEDAAIIHVEIEKTMHRAFVAAKDEANDLAVLKLEKVVPCQPLVLGDFSTVKTGDHVYALGFPPYDSLGRSIRITDGIVSSTVGFRDDPRMFQITAPVQPGNSGGPLFNDRGEVIGITTWKLFFSENIAFAIKVAYLNTLLTSTSLQATGRHKDEQTYSARDTIDRFSKSVLLVESQF